ERFSSEVTFSPNMRRLQDEAVANSQGGRVNLSRPEIAPADYVRFGQSDLLSGAIYTAEARANSDSLTAIDEEKGGGGGPMVMGSGGRPGMGEGQGDPNLPEAQGTQYYFKLIAGQYGDFERKLRELDEGAFPAEDDECMVSADLLESSGLAVGDTIFVTSSVMVPGADPSEGIAEVGMEWELRIVGTYKDATDEYSDGYMQNAYTNRRNEIIVTFDAMAGKMVDGAIGISVGARYFLRNPGLLEEYAAEVYAKGLNPIYDVTTDSGNYDKVVGPVESLKGISVAFAALVIGFGAVILALLSSMAVRERKYEIGVLRAMGMRRSKVTLGIWAETLAVTVLCLALGLGVGAAVAQPVTDVMLRQQVEAAEKAEAAIADNMPAGPMTVRSMGGMRIGGGEQRVEAEPLSELDVSLGLGTLAEIAAVALLLTSMAGVIATRKITKYEPIKILMERN
ncbi:MAG: ABC transporter permease, partial [Oscillospiraceae bacterium]|nr:ABC transporter permease [Oscillospiraceae bacterium]